MTTTPFKTHLKRFARDLLYLGASFRYLRSLADNPGAPLLVPPGHFYSPQPDMAELRRNEGKIWHIPDAIPGIDLNQAEQVAWLRQCQQYYDELPPFGTTKSEETRFYYQNGSFPPADAIMLYSMLRHLQPRTIIEAGSGYSSCVMLDTNERFFQNHIDLTFIEPYPARFLSLIRPDDNERITLLEKKLQDLDLARFAALQPHDILFIDSTHVSKTGSDVNYLFFEILPRLPSGVYIHIHDIAYPFEYPPAWSYRGLGWNEAYTLRAFLQYNQAFKIVAFNSYLTHTESAWLAQHMPLCADNGCSIWLKKL